jgi:hypothetical protein
MTTDEDIKAVEKALGEPVFIGLSEEATKVRSRLLLLAILTTALSIGRVQIKSGAPFFGLQLSGLTDDLVTKALAAGLLYLLVHFLWLSSDSFLEWRLRITGTRLAHVTTAKLASGHGDYPDDPRQSTLYGWWLGQAKNLESVTVLVNDLRSATTEWEVRVKAALEDLNEPGEMSRAQKQVDQIANKITNLEETLKRTKDTIGAARVPVSLKRFDGWYRAFSISQNLRWLIIDALIPIGLGIVGIILSFVK